jgi:hypothetical protein
MPLILGANSLTGGYEVDNSLRFNSGSSDYLNRTPSGGNYQISTFSGWVKRSILGTQQHFFSFSPTDNNQFNISFSSDNTLQVYSDDVPTLQILIRTNRVFRDVSAWYHVFVAYDTTQGTASNRVKIYINGIQETSFSTATYPSLNANLQMNGNVNLCTVGTYRSPFFFYNGYLSEFNWIDGQALDPTDFGEFDEDSGIWKPIAYTGTYGTNGFYLEFQDSSALGDDTSGNGNDFTVNNLTSIDQTTDTPTNNFATLNPLIKSGSPTYANGNTQIATIGDNDSVVSSIGTDNMKFYFEVKLSSTYDGSGGGINVGGLREEQFNASGFNSGTYSGFNLAYTKFYGNSNDGRFKEGNATVVTSGLTRAVANDIVMIAIDPANNRVYAGVNGTWLNSSDPVAGTGFIGGTQATGTGNWFGYHSSDLDKGDCFVNYGNPAYTISSGNSDENGIGLFEYSVPSGYFSLCTANLAEFG